MPPRKRKPSRQGPSSSKSTKSTETPAGAVTTDAGGRPRIDPETGLPIVAGQEASTDDDA